MPSSSKGPDRVKRPFAIPALLSLLLAGSAPVDAQVLDDGSGLKTSAAVDIVGKGGGAGLGRKNRLEVREAELMLYSPVDHLFHGRLTLAAHLEPDGSFFEVHEAFLGSTKMIPRSRFRLGQYFLGVGRLNQIHRHDWPFISAPKVQAEFFGMEGVLDTGGEFSTLLPTPFYWDLTVGIANGWTFGHSHSLGAQPDVPTHYIRSVNFLDLPNEGGIQIGLNYLGRKNEAGTRFHYAGLDATAKWRRGKTLAFLLQSEIWGRVLDPAAGPAETTLGAYLYPQVGLSPQWYLGLRGDYYSVLSLKSAAGGSVNNGTYAAVPTLTFRPSEFATIRAAYTLEYDKPDAAGGNLRHGFEFQATFILGAHPAHDF
jgi:hypothetical protein